MTIVLGAFGTVIGSFLNVVIYRVPLGRSVVSPPSACGSCGHAIRWYDNIPIVSWLVLRGRCRDCGARISVRYPLIELAGAAAFVLVAVRFLPEVLGASTIPLVVAAIVQLVAYLYLSAISVALAVIDVETHRLPHAIVRPAYLVALVAFVACAWLTGQWIALAIAAIGAAGMWLLYAIPRFIRPDAMGGGDVALAGVLGAFLGWLGWQPLVVGVIAGFLLGGIFGLARLLITRDRKAQVAYGPWMLAGAWLGILVGGAVAEWYLGLFGLGSVIR